MGDWFLIRGDVRAARRREQGNVDRTAHLSKNGFRDMGISFQVYRPQDAVASYRPHLCDEWN